MMQIRIVDGSEKDGVPTEFVGGPADGQVLTVNRKYLSFVITTSEHPDIPDGSDPKVLKHKYLLDITGEPKYRCEGVVV